MPDVTVTFGAKDDGLSSAIAKWRAEMGMAAMGGGGGGYGTPLTPPPPGMGGPPPPPGPLIQAAMAQVAAKKKLADQNKETAKSEEELGQAAAHSSGMFERLSRRIVEAGLIYGALRAAAALTKEAITKSMDFESAQVQLTNFNLGVADTSGEVAKLQQIASATKIATTDLFGPLATLQMTGTSLKDATDQMERLGQFAKVTGEPIAKVAELVAKLNLREAGIGDMLSVAQVMGPDIQQMALDYHQMTVDAPIIAREEAIAAEQFHRHMEDLERSASLQRETYHRQTEDIERVTSAQNSFAEKTGLAKAALSEITTGHRARLPAVFSGINIDEMMRNLKGQLSAGMGQMSKDLGLSLGDIQTLTARGAISPEDLISAARTAQDQQTKTFDRAQQDQQRLRQQQKTDFDRQVQDKANLRALDEQNARFNVMAAEQAYLEHPSAEQAERLNKQFQNYKDTTKSVTDTVGQSWSDALSHAGDLPRSAANAFQDVTKDKAHPLAWLDPVSYVQSMVEHLSVSATGGKGGAPVTQQDVIANENKQQTNLLSDIRNFLKVVLGVPTSP